MISELTSVLKSRKLAPLKAAPMVSLAQDEQHHQQQEHPQHAGRGLAGACEIPAAASPCCSIHNDIL